MEAIPTFNPTVSFGIFDPCDAWYLVLHTDPDHDSTTHHTTVGNSKAKASSDSWRQKVLSGSLFTNLGGIEASEKQANRQRCGCCAVLCCAVLCCAVRGVVQCDRRTCVCVCVYVYGSSRCMHAYMYIQKYIPIRLYDNMCACICMYVHVCTVVKRFFLSVWPCSCVCVCVCVQLRTYIPVHIHAHALTRMHAFDRVCACVNIHDLCGYVCVCAFVRQRCLCTSFLSCSHVCVCFCFVHA